MPKIAMDQPRDDLPHFSTGDIILDRFEIIRSLGKGGMGEVFEARDLELDVFVALKTIRPEIAHDPKTLQRFKHEVHLARRIASPFICRIHELFVIPHDAVRNQLIFLTMELLEGLTLADHLLEQGPIPWRQAEAIVQQLCEGLKCIHEAGVVHRDLKSRNIMLVERNGMRQAVVMDFGLAWEATGKNDTTVLALTQSGAILGTPGYMAPEQFEGTEVSPATDIYALGVVLYEMVTASHPFDASTLVTAALKRAKFPPKASSLQRGLPKRWDGVIERCLEYEAGLRYQSADECASALFNRPFSITQLPRHVSSISRRYTWAVPLSAGLAIVCCALLFWALTHVTHEPPANAMRWYRLGVAALREGTYVKAERALNEAVRVDPTFALAHARLADAWAELDFTGKAEHEMLLASAPDQRLPELDREYREAVRATLMHDFSGAIRVYRQILDRSPPEDKANAYLDLGRAYEKNSQIDAALKAYSKARDLAPEYPAAYTRLGILESREGNVAQGEKDFASAERIYRTGSNFEGLAEVDYQRAYTATTNGQLTEARKAAQDSLGLAEQIPSIQLRIRALGRLSAIETANKHYDLALELANKAVALAQDSGNTYWAADALLRLGSVYLTERQYDVAEPIFQRMLKLAINGQMPRAQANARSSLASIYNQERKPKEVIPLAMAALDYYRANGFLPESQKAFRLLLDAKKEQNDVQGALTSARELLGAAKRSGNLPLTLDAESEMGDSASQLGRYPEALDHFRHSLDLSHQLGQEIDEQSLDYAAALWHVGQYAEAEHLISGVSREFAPDADAMEAELKLSQLRWTEAA
ncbi:MAG: protein kinase, partial [Bryobacteraceae bacterium]